MLLLRVKKTFRKLVFPLILTLAVWPVYATETLRLGVSSFAEHNINKGLIDPTIEAIRKAVQPDKLEVECLELGRLQNSLKNGQLDLVLSSAGNYRRFLLEGYGLRDLATMVSNQAPNPNYAEGSVFFVRSDRNDLDSIGALKNKSVSANYPFAFSGWQIAAGELLNRDFDPDHFFSKVDFLGHGASPVIEAVLSGKTDAGIVRACVLENAGLLKSGLVKVLDPKETTDFPCAVSTRLYPNWTLSTTPNTAPEVSRKVTAAVLEIKPLQNNLHWSVATDFTPIDDLFKGLEIGPFEYLRHFSFKRFMEAYWQYLVFAAIFIIGLILHGIRSEYLVNRRTHALTESLKRERKLRAESALVKSRLDKIQKVGLVGQMCSMIAHELKQPLGAAAAYCFALRRRMESGEVSAEMMEKGIERVDHQIQRASEVVHQVRSYAKGQRQRLTVDVGKTAEKILLDISASAPDTDLEFRKDSEELFVEANPIELEIILINLVKNAIEVVKDKSNGRVVVTLSAEGNTVCIKVEDNGEKLSDAEWKQISQLAMATTKHSGLGFGLSIVAGLAEDLGGRITFERIPSGGLSVFVRLPLAKEKS